jgi:hypothetical protein
MYEWYARSTICLAYLDDVDSGANISENDRVDLKESQYFASKPHLLREGFRSVPPVPVDAGEPIINETSFQSSCWFSRGWTLQELVAPKIVEFYCQKWSVIGRKGDNALCRTISNASGVSEEVLKKPESMQDFSVAQKFAWAASRETTRPEDQAYSLLGLFGVNLPPLYGEGQHRAFRRLQLEIMKVTNDHTIFAWDRDSTSGDMLALAIQDFRGADHFQRLSPEHFMDAFGLNAPKLDYAMTNVGLQIELPLYQVPKHSHLFFAFLACKRNQGGLTAICLLERKYRSFTSYHRVPFNGSTIYRFPPFSPKYRSQFPQPRTIWISERIDTSPKSWISEKLHYTRWRPRLGVKELRFKLSHSYLSFKNGKPVDIPFSYENTLQLGQFDHMANTTLGWPPVDIAFGEVDMKIWLYVGTARYEGLSVPNPSVIGRTRVPTRGTKAEFRFPTGHAWQAVQDQIVLLEDTWSSKSITVWIEKIEYRVELSTNLYDLYKNESAWLNITIGVANKEPLGPVDAQ